MIRARLAVVLACGVFALAGSSSLGADGAVGADASTFSIGGKSYDTVLTLPENEPIALAVLFGGGLATDLHWTVPGSFGVAGQEIRFTITGEPTRDADAIAAALLARDIAVYQFSSIPRDDPMYATNPGLAVGIPYPQSRDIACAALADATARPRLEGLPVICTGHSLGAARALQCAEGDARIAGFVLLSGAYLSNPRENPSVIEQEMVDAFRVCGADLDAGATEHQFRVAHTNSPQLLRRVPFADLDIDDDARVRRWEIASALHCAMRDAGDHSFEREKKDLGGETLPGEIMISAHKPTLLIYGGLDPMAYHGPMVAMAASDAGDTSWMMLVYERDLGHNLGPVIPRTDGFVELGGSTLTGPIDPGVCDRIAAFAAEIARQ